MGGKLYNIPASCSFVDTLARIFGRRYEANPLELSKVLFLVPTRRTALSLKEAFIRFNGCKPAVLPRILPVADVDQDDVFLFDTDRNGILEQLPPAIDPYQRLFLFAKMIASRPREYGLPPMTWGQAFALAQDLSKMLDAVYHEQLSLADLSTLVPDQYAAHWQETLRFLQIITAYWPDILHERGVIDTADRYSRTLDLEAQKLLQNRPEVKIVAAGITGAFPGLRKLVSAIAQIPEGEVYFYNLDRYLSQDVWAMIDENHPQFEHKQLLDFMQIKRDEVQDCEVSPLPEREWLGAEVMRPAFDSWRWRYLKDNHPALADLSENLHILNCENSRQEALSVALILRETLNTPEKTAALVTPDRLLARRVASELERWGIKIDDSAGKPLHLMPVGIFLRLVVDVLEKDMSDSALLSVLKHPLMHMNEENSELRQKIRQWEKLRRMPLFGDQVPDIPAEVTDSISKFKEAIRPLAEIFTQTTADFKYMLETHIKVAESLAGADNLWRGEDGRQAAALLGKILPAAEIVGNIEPRHYSGFLSALLASQIVRSNYNSHPRIKILGPIEARHNHFDTVIIGSVNEGVWPATPAGDPWMSRPMKKEFGLPLPEKAIGVMAADFSQLLCAPEVYLTRSARSNGTPMNKSRWQLRLETVLYAAGFNTMEPFCRNDALLMAQCLDQAQKPIKINAPEPRPPFYARPRRLAAGAVETLMRDPYEIYAAKILKLKPLNELDVGLSVKDYGDLIHKILDIFCKQYPDRLPDKAREILLKIGGDEFVKKQIASEVRAFWWPKFVHTVDWILQQEKTYRQNISAVHSELQGQLEFETAGGKFVLEARADRVDENPDGSVNIIDYKTGEIRSNKELEIGYAPQLPLEGLIAYHGGFAGLPPATVNSLSYWKLGEKSQTYCKDVNALVEQTFEHLKQLITAFDFETTPYVSRPNPKHLLKYANYEHLARVKEWSSEESNES